MRRHRRFASLAEKSLVFELPSVRRAVDFGRTQTAAVGGRFSYDAIAELSPASLRLGSNPRVANPDERPRWSDSRLDERPSVRRPAHLFAGSVETGDGSETMATYHPRPRKSREKTMRVVLHLSNVDERTRDSITEGAVRVERIHCPDEPAEEDAVVKKDSVQLTSPLEALAACLLRVRAFNEVEFDCRNSTERKVHNFAARDPKRPCSVPAHLKELVERVPGKIRVRILARQDEIEVKWKESPLTGLKLRAACKAVWLHLDSDDDHQAILTAAEILDRRGAPARAVELLEHALSWPVSDKAFLDNAASQAKYFAHLKQAGRACDVLYQAFQKLGWDPRLKEGNFDELPRDLYLSGLHAEYQLAVALSHCGRYDAAKAQLNELREILKDESETAARRLLHSVRHQTASVVLREFLHQHHCADVTAWNGRPTELFDYEPLIPDLRGCIDAFSAEEDWQRCAFSQRRVAELYYLIGRRADAVRMLDEAAANFDRDNDYRNSELTLELQQAMRAAMAKR
jgi:hypothetical protein